MTEVVAILLAGIALPVAGWALRQVHALSVEVAVLGRDDKHVGRSIDLMRQDMIARLERIETRLDRIEVSGRNGRQE